MNTPLLSIIVPVYKVEEYLEDSVNNIIAQTFEGEFDDQTSQGFSKVILSI